MIVGIVVNPVFGPSVKFIAFEPYHRCWDPIIAFEILVISKVRYELGNVHTASFVDWPVLLKAECKSVETFVVEFITVKDVCFGVKSVASCIPIVIPDLSGLDRRVSLVEDVGNLLNCALVFMNEVIPDSNSSSRYGSSIGKELCCSSH